MRSSKLLRVFTWLLVTGLSVGLLGALAAMLIYQHYAHDLPDYSQLAKYEPPITTRIYASNGKFMAEYATEKRIYVPLPAIPRRVVQAFLSAEDRNFYQHAGVDIYGVARAVRENVQKIGQNQSLVGGSTITQQVVKNFLLSREQSVERKVKEAILAFRITEAYSKDRILELYLNQIFLGYRSYGVAAAALNYFNKSLDDLTIEEAALLAAMPKAPSSTSPTRNYDYAKARRDWVIGRMMEDGYLTPEEAADAQKKPILMRTRDEAEIARADFFTEEVRRTLAAMYGRNVLYEGGLSVRTTLDPELQAYADEALREALVTYDRRHGWHGTVTKLPNVEGWKDAFRTLAPTLAVPLFGEQQLAVVLKLSDSAAQIGLIDGNTESLALSEMKWARKRLDTVSMGPQIKKPSDVLSVGDVVLVGPVPSEKPAEKKEDGEKKEEKKAGDRPWRLEQVPDVNGAMVVMDPHTGKVLAMAGGYSGLNTDFNRATQAKRQPGSAFKPFVYLTALENGFTPASIVDDSPVELSQGAGLPAWKPQNYKNDYLGPATLRVGVEKSRNAMTVRLAVALGIDRIIKASKRFGIYDAPPRNFSIVLGAVETTLLRLSNAYSTVANGGYKVIPTMIERIDDRNGQTIFRRDARNCAGCVATQGQVLTDGTPPLPADSRERILDPRVAYQVTSILEGVVQRGTATRAKVIGKPVAGKTGTTNDSRDTWFMGFTPDLVVGTYIGFDAPKPMGGKETGGSVALPAFIAFMQKALKDAPATPFTVPAGIQLVGVDLHSGLPSSPEFGGRIIQEAFLTGEPPFVPGRDPKDAPVVTAPAPIVEDPNGLLPDDYSDRPWLLPQSRQPVQPVVPAPSTQPGVLGTLPQNRYENRYDPRRAPQPQGYAPPPSNPSPSRPYQSRYPVYEQQPSAEPSYPPAPAQRRYPDQQPRPPVTGTGGLY